MPSKMPSKTQYWRFQWIVAVGCVGASACAGGDSRPGLTFGGTQAGAETETWTAEDGTLGEDGTDGAEGGAATDSEGDDTTGGGPDEASAPTDVVHLGANAIDGRPMGLIHRMGLTPLFGAPQVAGAGVVLRPALSSVGGTGLALSGSVVLGGEVAPDGDYGLVLRVYDEPSTAASALVGSYQFQVSVRGGLFTLEIPQSIGVDVVLEDHRWLGWEFDGVLLAPLTEIGAVPLAAYTERVAAGAVRPSVEAIGVEAFEAPPVAVRVGEYAPGELVDTGLPDAWLCQHRAAVHGNVRVTSRTPAFQYMCGVVDAYQGAAEWEVDEFEAFVGDAHPSVTCTSLDPECPRRVGIQRAHRSLAFSCFGVPDGEWERLYLTTTQTEIPTDHEAYTHLRVHVVSTCRPG